MVSVWTSILIALLLFPSIGSAAGINATVKIGLCGDGVVDTTEECDGASLGSRTCASEGFGGGELTCMPSCDLNTSGCTAAPPPPPPPPPASSPLGGPAGGAFVGAQAQVSSLVARLTTTLRTLSVGLLSRALATPVPAQLPQFSAPALAPAPVSASVPAPSEAPRGGGAGARLFAQPAPPFRGAPPTAPAEQEAHLIDIVKRLRDVLLRALRVMFVPPAELQRAVGIDIRAYTAAAAAAFVSIFR